MLQLPSFIWMSLASFFSIVCAGQWILKAFEAKVSPSFFEELHSRFKTWAYILIILSVALILKKTGILWLFGVVSFLAFKEYVSIVPGRQEDRRTLFWAYLAIPLQYFLISQGCKILSLIFVPTYMFMFIPIRLVITGETKGFLKSLSFLHWGLMGMLYCVSHVAMFFIAKNPLFSVSERLLLVVYLLMLTECNDVFQYVFGKLLGNKKILPKISPGKTWAGFLGGLFATSLLAFLIGPKITPLSTPLLIGSGVVIAVAGFFGDVTISAVKRDLKIKDTGASLPGHGGIIDRIDSLIFTAPAFYHFINYFWAPL